MPPPRNVDEGAAKTQPISYQVSPDVHAAFKAVAAKRKSKLKEAETPQRNSNLASHEQPIG